MVGKYLGFSALDRWVIMSKSINKISENVFGKKELLLGCCVVLLGSLVIAYFAYDRKYFTFSTETDYISREIKIAQLLLDGEPLVLEFHPPLYSIIIASFQIIFRDWFTTGLVVSWISSVIVLLTSFMFFNHLAGRYAAWGSLVGLMSSQLFLTYSSLATQDLFFLALYSSCFLLTILALQNESRTLWGLTGFILGCALLTRANSLTLLILLVVPWFQPRNFRACLKDFSCFLIAVMVVLGVWGVAAKLTNSHFGPQLGHVNLAMRYFSTEGDPFTVEAREHLMTNFSSYKDVFLYNPRHIAVTYAKDFMRFLIRSFQPGNVLSFPFSLFALPGIFLLFFTPRNIFSILFLIATISQIALLGFKEYEERYYMFLIPVFSAGAGLCLRNIYVAIPEGWTRIAALIIFLPFIIVGMKNTLTETYQDLHAQDVELGEVIPIARRLIHPKGLIICRKEHVPYYVGVRKITPPDLTGLNDFRGWIEQLHEKVPIYIYFGSEEKIHRKHLSELSFAERAPDWLEPIAKGQTPNRWVLYEFKPSS